MQGGGTADGTATAPRLGLSVRSLEGAEILPAGTLLDEATLAAVAEAGGRVRWQRRSILEHGTVRRDIASTSRTGNYATVFGSPEEYRDLETIMAATLLPEPCLRGLDWFRDNDGYTYRHILMVFALSCLLAQRSERTGPRLRVDSAAGPLHDFGKLCIPAAVLGKCTPLTRAERRTLEQHTLAGHVLLCHYLGTTDDFTALVARDHHERRDRSGYPRAVPLLDPLIEIVAVCDVYDALVSPRPYRRASFDNRTALEELTAMAERGRIGWEVVQVLVALNRRERPAPERTTVSRQKRGTPPAGNLYGIYEDG
ncbi:MAG TPA: HD domain-containing phosphohydrolase [Candidatus Methanoperedens sp.]|nr:HD domain-containing phosphohydrolase [Candidatus Methanoperedens sp.]